MHPTRIATIVMALVLTLLVAVPAAAGQADPAEGDGNKTVISRDLTYTLECPNGSVLAVDVEGWEQVLPAQDGTRILERRVFHLVATHTNAAGETWRYVDSGPELVFLVDGVPHIAIVGRPGFVPDPDDPGTFSSLSGRMVINIETGEIVSVAGHLPGTNGEEQACAALT